MRKFRGEQTRKCCEKIRKRNYPLWYNKTTNVELLEQRISHVFCAIDCCSYGFRGFFYVANLFSAKFRIVFTFFRLIHFRKKMPKFRQIICEKQTKIYIFGRKFSFAGNPSCKDKEIGKSDLWQRFNFFPAKPWNSLLSIIFNARFLAKEWHFWFIWFTIARPNYLFIKI